MEQTRHRGLARAGWMFKFKAAAFNLIRLPKLMPTGLVYFMLAQRQYQRSLGARKTA